MKTLLIDGNSLVNRAFYALPLLTTQDGVYTNGVYGFLKMFFKAIDEYNPDNVVCAFDVKQKTFRHEAYGEYKAGRKKMPEELVPQIPLLKEVLTSLGVFCYEQPGFEADDIIGTYSSISEKNGGECVILTGDQDSFQLIDKHTEVWFTKKGISDVLKLTPDNLKENYGVDPGLVCDFKALMGDSSDNIPGVQGVGEKTALSLIEKFGSLDGIFQHCDEISGKLGEKLRLGKEDAYKSKFLVTIVRDMNVPDIENTKYVQPDAAVAGEIFNKYGFKSLLPNKEQTIQEHSFKTLDFFESSGENVLKNADRLAVCFTETCVLLAADENTQYSLSLAFDLFSGGIDFSKAQEIVLSLINTAKTCCFYDAKSVMHTLNKRLKIDDDIMLAQYLLDTGSTDFSLKNICQAYNTQQGACALIYIAEKQKNLLEKFSLVSLYKDVELPLAEVLFEMEITGFYVDSDILRSLGDELNNKIAALSKDIYALAGCEFNINSPIQLSDVLFNKLELPATKKTKRGFSTDNDVLEQLEHPIAQSIIAFRQAQKLKSTYIDGLFAVISPKTGRIHSTFNQAVTATGRISSTEPNLQNIPVRNEEGRNIRKAFMAEKEDFVLVNADYSQIELRVLAHLSGDKRLIQAFIDGEDIHARTAAEVYGVDINSVTKEMRSAAKAVNFGIIYGISDFGLAKSIGCTRHEASIFIQRYFEKYPSVKEFMENSVKNARTKGYAETILGRRREIKELFSKNYNVRSFGERAAMNSPVQGSAADIIKLAMLKVFNALENSSINGKLILQVHDELILEVHKNDALEAEKLLKQCMENVISLSVPLKADTNKGKTWYELK